MTLSLQLICDAVDIYLQCAYPSDSVPAHVQARVQFDQSAVVDELIKSPPFVQTRHELPEPGIAYSLRLGSQVFPHLKLEIRPYPGTHGAIFWVNTHDNAYSPPIESPDYEPWQAIQLSNRKLKQEVERKWTEAGLPTFYSEMRSSIDQEDADRN